MPTKNALISHSAVVTVGDELIFGERSNQNSEWMLAWLQKQNRPARIALSLADDPEIIALWLKQLRAQKHDLILVSGGIGGTHDDCTREGIAMALDVPIAKHPECWEILSKRYGAELNTSRANMAMLPEGCQLIPNPHGAPGFHQDGIFAFPGFPKMLHSMIDFTLPFLNKEENQQSMKIEEVRLQMREGDASDPVRAFSLKHPEARLGIYAHAGKSWGQITLRFRYPESNPELLQNFKDFVKTLNAPILQNMKKQ